MPSSNAQLYPESHMTGRSPSTTAVKPSGNLDAIEAEVAQVLDGQDQHHDEEASAADEDDYAIAQQMMADMGMSRN